MPIPSTIYLRLLLPFAGVLVVSMGSAWWIASGLLTATLEQRLDERLGQALEVLNQGTFPLTDDLLARAATLVRADIVFLDTAGNPQLSTMSPDNHFDFAVLEDELARLEGEADPAAVDVPGYRIIVRATARDPRFAAVAAVARTDDMRAAARQTGIGLGITTLLATLLLGIAAHRLVRSIVRPVERLSAMAERIAEGERDVRVGVERVDEIGALTRSLNDMARRLADYETELAAKTRLSALGEMSARIAHEIRNPLMALRLKLELLAESERPATAAEVAPLLREIERLDMIVTSALSIARPERVTASPADLNAIVEDLAGLVTPQLDHLKIELILDLAHVPDVPLDEGRVKQVLFNLVNNAAAAMPDGGRLRISTARADGDAGVALAIEDSGPGIPRDRWDRVFALKEASGDFKLGLGLGLCRELVELHGGSIAVDESPELGGARFIAIFPDPIIASATA